MTCLMSKICAKADGCDIHVGTNIKKCSAFKEKQTNFSRITASPEALAEFIVSLEYDKEDFPNSYKEEYDNLLEWLKQESK